MLLFCVKLEKFSVAYHDFKILIIIAKIFNDPNEMATNQTNAKKRLIISYNNLTPELQDELKKQYPTGYTDKMIRIEKGPGDFFYAVLLETPDINYLVKVDVKIDDDPEEDDDKGFYDEDDIKGAEEIASDDDDDDEM
jgi:hypothetical protein